MRGAKTRRCGKLTKAAFLSIVVAWAGVAHLKAMVAADLASLPLVTLNSSYMLKTLSGFDLSQATWGPSVEGLSLAVFPAPMADTAKKSIVVLIKNESKDEEQLGIINGLPALKLTDQVSEKKVWGPSFDLLNFFVAKFPSESVMAFQIPLSYEAVKTMNVWRVPIYYSKVKGLTLCGELGMGRPDHSSVSLRSEPFSIGG